MVEESACPPQPRRHHIWPCGMVLLRLVCLRFGMSCSQAYPHEVQELAILDVPRSISVGELKHAVEACLSILFLQCLALRLRVAVRLMAVRNTRVVF